MVCELLLTAIKNKMARLMTNENNYNMSQRWFVFVTQKEFLCKVIQQILSALISSFAKQDSELTLRRAIRIE